MSGHSGIAHTYLYHIVVAGGLQPEDLRRMSPLPVLTVQTAGQALCFTVTTDQSGLLGLIRALHGRGVALLSVRRTS